MQFSYPNDLPVSHHHDEIIALLSKNQVVIVAGETGSGKTTQLPKMCLELSGGDNTGIIGCTQPRRIAAMTVSGRVAEELGEHGDLVGHKIRFHDRTNEKTKIKFMTDGVLLAETKKDNLLKQYSFLIIDEAHERSLNIDFLLGYLKKLLPKRPDLKVIITSATIDTTAFSNHFNKAPVLSVVGKTYPVELRYAPPESDDFGEYDNYADHCITTIFNLYMNEPPGDILIFLPTEKDIRYCCESLENMITDADILPLFGRLQPADQKKIFIPSSKTKIVVATNVAETSITVPGIRYVIDTGLARMAYYNFRAKTNSLPIRKISRAGCDQRKGRCGRVSDGICIRLFSEDDYMNREEYTLPEIQRSNLAEVVLQMLSHDLGDPLSFPFIDPPHVSAIRDGYRLLQELGAIDTNNTLTKTGKSMAAMPIDPCIARIIIEAGSNNCLSEIKIIASALAIQDPRLRPAEHEKIADEAHEQFSHPQSDFMAYLSIWRLYHAVKGQTSWSQLKKFCKANYLSFQRMREWIDLHEQMTNILEREKKFIDNTQEASYEQIHKSLAIGFLRNLAVKKSGKIYQGPMGKEIMIFPGSKQFTTAPQWLIAAAFLETSRVYALTVASIQPEWVESIAGSLCRFNWSHPRFQKKSGQVVADEKVTLFGLVIVSSRIVNFGRTNLQNRKEARSIFLQSALINGELQGAFDFLTKNLELIKKWQDVEHQIRVRDLVVSEQDLFHFYDERIPDDVYDRHTLQRYLKNPRISASLRLSESDILNRKPAGKELADFPLFLTPGSHSFPLSYVFDPLSQEDGVTVRIPYNLADSLNPDYFEWLVPGLIKEKTLFLLRGLPKRIRKHLIPLNTAVEKILDDVEMYKGSYIKALQASIAKQFNLHLSRADWTDQLPQHLLMRFSLYDQAEKEVAQGRNLKELLISKKDNTTLSPKKPGENEQKQIDEWSKKLINTWDFVELPESIPLLTSSGLLAGFLYPAITPVEEKNSVTINFLESETLAGKQNRSGLQFLYRLHFAPQYKDLKKYCSTSFSGPSSLWLIGMFETRKKAIDALLDFILQTLFKTEDGIIPDRKTFKERIEKVQQKNFYKLGVDICDAVLALLRRRREVSEKISHYSGLTEKSRSFSQSRYQEYKDALLENLPENFLTLKKFEDLENCDRYLRSLGIRIERAHADFLKDQKKTDQLRPHINNLQTLRKRYNNLSKDCMLAVDEYEKMIQEMRISLFSPEIKTLFPVSLNKLSQIWKKILLECNCKASLTPPSG